MLGLLRLGILGCWVLVSLLSWLVSSGIIRGKGKRGSNGKAREELSTGISEIASLCSQ